MALLGRIVQHIKTEGFLSYVRRLVCGGVYLHEMNRILRSRKLAQNSVTLWAKPFFLSTRPGGLTEELQLYETHEPVATKFYLCMLKAHDIVFDIGSNVGYYAAAATSISDLCCEVFCFEPDPELFSLLEKNKTVRNELWHTIPNAVSDIDGQVTFFVSDISNWGGIRPENVARVRSCLHVQSVTLDKFCSNRGIFPTVLRMDVEGAELNVLRGAKEILKRRPRIFMELHLAFLFPDEKDELNNILLAAGYKRATVIKRYYDTPWAIKWPKKSIVYEQDLNSIFNLKEYDGNTLSLLLV